MLKEFSEIANRACIALFNIRAHYFVNMSQWDLQVSYELATVKNVREWNETISKIDSIPYRALIESSGLINSIL
jgi:hypothetical protein